jgi:hypothetical protein
MLPAPRPTREEVHVSSFEFRAVIVMHVIQSVKEERSEVTRREHCLGDYTRDNNDNALFGTYLLLLRTTTNVNERQQTNVNATPWIEIKIETWAITLRVHHHSKLLIRNFPETHHRPPSLP